MLMLWTFFISLGGKKSFKIRPSGYHCFIFQIYLVYMPPDHRSDNWQLKSWFTFFYYFIHVTSGLCPIFYDCGALANGWIFFFNKSLILFSIVGWNICLASLIKSIEDDFLIKNCRLVNFSFLQKKSWLNFF